MPYCYTKITSFRVLYLPLEFGPGDPRHPVFALLDYITHSHAEILMNISTALHQEILRR